MIHEPTPSLQMPLLDYFSGVNFLRLEDSALFCDIDAFTTELTEQIPAVDKVLSCHLSLHHYTNADY